MDRLRKEIADIFGSESQPNATTLVVWDGFDELEKKDAVAFYS